MDAHIQKLWGREIMHAYRSNLVLAELGKTACDTCAMHKTREYFWTKTTCRSCYTGARK